jgi:hypothetical protein
VEPKRICLVTHCFCPPGMSTYAEHVRCMWASLVQYPARAEVTLAICLAHPDDDPVTWAARCSETFQLPARAQVRFRVMRLNELFRRAIGRNHFAKQTLDLFDVYWFVDCDYMFGPGCMDALAAQVGPDDYLCTPDTVMITVDHATGEDVLKETRTQVLPQIPFETYVPKKTGAAIGGLQIVGGNTARKFGYCDGTKWVKPVDPAGGWRDTGEDSAFRRSLSAVPIRRLDLPHVYRFRHFYEDGTTKNSNRKKRG